MLLKKIINFIAGYVSIEVEGYYIERFINSCMKQGIELWAIKRKMTTILNCKVPDNKKEQAKEIAKKHQCLFTIKNQRGIPILIKRYKKRKIFLIAFLLVIITIYSLSKFIWNIEIQGTEKIDSNEIMRQINMYGLKMGMLKSNIDVDKITNKIRMEMEDIAWIGIEIKGTNAIVKVVEAKEKPEIIDESNYTNIVAAKARRDSKGYGTKRNCYGEGR